MGYNKLKGGPGEARKEQPTDVEVEKIYLKIGKASRRPRIGLLWRYWRSAICSLVHYNLLMDFPAKQCLKAEAATSRGTLPHGKDPQSRLKPGDPLA